MALDAAQTDPSDRETLKDRTLHERRAILDRLEAERGTHVLTLVYRREPWLAEDGSAGMVVEDAEELLAQIRAIPKEQPIDIVLHTPGGLSLAAEMLAYALKKHPGKVTAMVPFYAMSAGTLIALAADEIRLEPFAVLGPLEPQIQGRSATSLLNLLEQKPVEAIADETLMQADLARKAKQEVHAFIHWLLKDRTLSDEERERIAGFLTSGYLSADQPLTWETVGRFGLAVHADVPDPVFELFRTCQFGDCNRPRLIEAT